MSYKKSISLNKDKMFLGKKTKSTKIAKEEFKKNKFVINNLNNLARQDACSTEQILNFDGSNYICQDCLNSHKEKNRFLGTSFCFICGIFVKDDEYNYLIDPSQKICLINELNKYGIIFPEKKEDKISLEEQRDIKIGICNNCHLAYYKIIKPYLMQDCENNLIKLKDKNSNSQIGNPTKKEVKFSEIPNNNYSKEEINSKLFNINIQDNIGNNLNNNNIYDKINEKTINVNNNNFINNNSKLDAFNLTQFNQNQANDDDINKNEYINAFNNNYLSFINNTSNEALNLEKDNNNLNSKIKNITSNNILPNLNNSNDSNNNLDYASKIPLIIQNYNINELNNINMLQNLKPSISNNFFKNDLNCEKNDDIFIIYIDMIQRLNAQNINLNNNLINDNNNKYDKLVHILQLMSKYLINYSDFNMENKVSIINDIETLTNIFYQILIEFNLTKNDNDSNQKLTDDNNNNESKIKDENNVGDKCHKKENPKKMEKDYDLYMKNIVKVKESIKFKLNVIEVYDKIKNIYILTLLKNIESMFITSQNIIQNEEKNPIFNGINGEQINNGNNSNCKFNDFSENINNDLDNNLFQTNKNKNLQDLFSSLKQINLPNFNLNSNNYDKNGDLNENFSP